MSLLAETEVRVLNEALDVEHDAGERWPGPHRNSKKGG